MGLREGSRSVVDVEQYRVITLRFANQAQLDVSQRDLHPGIRKRFGGTSTQGSSIPNYHFGNELRYGDFGLRTEMVERCAKREPKAQPPDQYAGVFHSPRVECLQA